MTIAASRPILRARSCRSAGRLVLSFLLLIGCSLIADGFGAHIPKGYIYFAMGFSVFVESVNLRGLARRRSKSEPVKLHEPYT